MRTKTSTKPKRAKVILVKDFLSKHPACAEGADFANQYRTMQQVWSNCNRSDWMLWILDHSKPMPDKMARLFACWCVRNTPLPDGRTTWDLLTDERSRNAVVIAEYYAEGRATDAELAAAWDAARDAARDAAWGAARAAARAAARDAAWDAARDAARATARDAAWDAARAAARDAAWGAARAAARAAAWDAARATARDAAWDAARAAAWAAQCRKIRKLIPNIHTWING